MAIDNRDPMDQDLDTAGLDNTPGTGTGMNAAQQMGSGDVSGMSDPGAGRDWSKSEGQAGSDYLHGTENDSSEGGPSRHGGMSSAPSGTSGGTHDGDAGAALDETRRAAREATERLREDYDNRGVSGNGSF